MPQSYAANKQMAIFHRSYGRVRVLSCPNRIKHPFFCPFLVPWKTPDRSSAEFTISVASFGWFHHRFHHDLSTILPKTALKDIFSPLPQYGFFDLRQSKYARTISTSIVHDGRIDEMYLMRALHYDNWIALRSNGWKIATLTAIMERPKQRYWFWAG